MKQPPRPGHDGTYIDDRDIALLLRNQYQLYLFFARLRDRRVASYPTIRLVPSFVHTDNSRYKRQRDKGDLP